MEMRNDCIVMKETNKLLYVSSKATRLPNDVQDMRGSWILSKWSLPELTIPGSIKRIALDLGYVGMAETIVFNDGVQSV